MDLRDIDVNEPAETPTPSVETPAEPVKNEEPVETPKEDPKPAEEPAKAPAEEPANVQPEAKETPQEPAQPKKSRAEERIRNLARENKELMDKIQQFQQQTAPELQNEEISSDDLNRVINERAMQAAELIIASQQVKTQY